MKSLIKRICLISAVAICVIAGKCSVGAFASDDFETGTINLNSTVENSAKVGDMLIIPELGWNRYDDLNSKIVYEGNFTTYTYTAGFNVYKGSYTHDQQITGEKIKFKFYGKKLRIITPMGVDFSGGNVRIDNIDYGNFNAYKDEINEKCCILFEKLNLKEGMHDVVITTLNGKSFTTKSINNWFGLDAIDTDGYLLPYDDTLTLNKSLLTLKKDNFEKLTTSVPENTEIIWSSSDNNVAAVDQTGKVTGVAAGQAVITAQIKGEDVSTTCNVIVSEGNVNIDNNVPTTNVPDSNTGDNINTDISTNSGNVYIGMADGNIKQSQKVDINNFITWYTNRDLDKSESPFYKIVNAKGNIEYLIHDKIVSFEIR